jgi:hypothetical protein
MSNSPSAGETMDRLTAALARLDARDDLTWLRAASLKERGERLIAVCRTATEIEESRLRSGLPPTKPAPWPASTWSFLKNASRTNEA